MGLQRATSKKKKLSYKPLLKNQMMSKKRPLFFYLKNVCVCIHPAVMCDENEDYKVCGPVFKPTCQNRDASSIISPQDEGCIEGCFCKAGYIMDEGRRDLLFSHNELYRPIISSKKLEQTNTLKKSNLSILSNFLYKLELSGGLVSYF